MSTDKIYVGAAIRLIAKFPDVDDLASATTLEMIFSAPDGTKTTRTATLATDGSDGRIKYDIDPTIDLTVTGPWEVQGRVVYGPKPYFSEKAQFVVHPHL
jgi:hypothetical protein